MKITEEVSNGNFWEDHSKDVSITEIFKLVMNHCYAEHY